jgi:hypothetical protein
VNRAARREGQFHLVGAADDLAVPVQHKAWPGEERPRQHRGLGRLAQRKQLVHPPAGRHIAVERKEHHAALAVGHAEH